MADLTGDGVNDLNITAAGSSVTIGGAIFQDAANTGSGTGGYNTFLAFGDDNDGNDFEIGLNTDDSNPFDPSNDEIDASKTKTVLLSNIPIIIGTGTGPGGNGGVVGVQYYEFRVDLNESNNTPSTQISLDQFKIYLSSSNTIENVSQLGTPVYDMDAGGNASVLLSEAGSSGSGTDDYSVLVPVANFGNADPATTYMYLYVQMGAAGTDWITNGGFEEWNLQNAGSVTGTKFNDLDSDGVRDAGENGVQGVTVFIDTNDNGVLDSGERSTVTDANGNYTFYGVAAGTYHIDEVVPAGSIQTTGEDEIVTVTGTGTFVVDPIGNHYLTPHVSIDKAFANVTDGPDALGGSTVINGALDVANYTIAVTNDGETDLTNVIVTDAAADGGAVAVLKAGNFNSGDADSDGVLDIGETWYYTATQTASQSDLDTNGGGDGDKDNSATVVATQAGASNTVTATDSAAAPIVQSPSIAITKVFNGWSGGDGDNIGDAAGDVGSYTIVVTNTGNVTLTNVVVTDPLTNATYNVGTLTPGQSSANLTESYVLSQADLDANGTVEAGNFKAGSIENTATATSNQTGPASASAVAPITYAPSIAIEKEFTGWADGEASGNKAGDVANYSIKVTNTGNVTLTNVTVVDPLTGQNITGVTLAPGASASYATTYTLTQTDLDNRGGGDDDIDNTATADSDQTGPVDDSAEAPTSYAPSVDLEKYVSKDGVTFIDADTAAAGYQNVGVQQSMYFKVEVENTGNVTLDAVKITDINTTGGTPGTTVTLFENGAVTGLVTSFAGDTDNDGELDVGEKWTLTYSQGFDYGQHVNTAYIATGQGASDNDAAYYFGILEGPGVRTPGFWQGWNNGALFWNGIQGDSKTGTGFTQNGDLLIYGNTNGTVDSNNDGVVNSNDKGLLIGDYNLNGQTDSGEDTLWISLADAKNLINASTKALGSDGVVMVGRDVVATWLNYLAGNGIGDASDPESPKHFIDDAVDWLQTFGDANKAGNTINPLETFDVYKADHGAVKTSSAYWNAPQGDIDHSASTMHTALDNYNNTGDTFAGGDPYAMNAHSSFDLMLMQASQAQI
ncbi:MAG: beta strand repeat-containing protein [Novosphingobium sp.]